MNNQQEKTLLSPDFVRELKKQAHNLKPVVQFGKKRVNDALIKEIDLALSAHELIKLRVAADHKENFEEDLQKIIAATGACHVDSIGNIVILYRKQAEE